MRFPLTWWQLMWALVFVSGFVFRVRTTADISEDPIDAWALFRIGLIVIVALVLFVRLTLKKSRWSPGLFSSTLGIFLLYPVISLVSTLWSASTAWTLYKSVEFLTDVLLLAAIVATLRSAEEYRKLVNWTWILLGLLTISAWVGAVVDPGDALFADPTVRIMALPARLVGVFPVVSCNELSEMSAILGLVALCRLMVDPDAQNKKGRYRVLFLAAMATLIITQTRGVFAAFFIGLVVLLILHADIVWQRLRGFLFDASSQPCFCSLTSAHPRLTFYFVGKVLTKRAAFQGAVKFGRKHFPQYSSIRLSATEDSPARDLSCFPKTAFTRAA